MPVILISEDADLIARITGSFLQRDGIEILPVRTASECLHLARTRRPEVAVLDAEAADGFEACRMLRGAGGVPTPVLMSGPSRLRDEAFACGAAGYLVRPVTRELLLAQMRRHLPLRERETDRLPVNLKVTCRTRDGSFIAFTHDLSRGGMALKMSHPPKPGSRVHVSFELPGERSLAVETDADVVREIAREEDEGHLGGAGLSFVAIPPMTGVAIGRFVREGRHV